MTKKVVKAAAKPIAPRKLNSIRRAKLLTFATTKFVATEERAVEKKHRDAIISTFLDYQAQQVAPVLATLRKFGAVKKVRALRLSYQRVIVTGTKQIEAPGGTMIDRTTSVILNAPVEMRTWHFEPGSIAGMTRGKYPTVDYCRADGFRRDTLIDLGQEIEVATSYRGNESSYFNVSDDDRITSLFRPEAEEKTGYYLPNCFYEAIDQFCLTGEVRFQAELKLHTTIAKIISAANTFEELLEIWPEANEIVDDLFDSPTAKIKTNFALVALSNEDKALLCSNMKSRGVKAAACSIAA